LLCQSSYAATFVIDAFRVMLLSSKDIYNLAISKILLITCSSPHLFHPATAHLVLQTHAY
jgi:hypothetical protein